jgi:hypothetical protein
MARIINIDEKLAAKGEIKNEPVQLVFRGKTWNFSAGMPAQMPELLSEGKIVRSVLLALDAEQRSDFEDLGITIDEVAAIVDSLASAYGSSEGESEASE